MVKEYKYIACASSTFQNNISSDPAYADMEVLSFSGLCDLAIITKLLQFPYLPCGGSVG